jgi:uncharacterized protein (DUF1330 family)
MIDIEDRALDLLLAEDPGGPVVMLNLLRFAPAGRESYQRYADALQSGISRRYGVEVTYLGAGGRALVAEDGQAWDMVVLVRYPSREAFAGMIRDPEYQAVAYLRTESLYESVLQPTIPLAAA